MLLPQPVRDALRPYWNSIRYSRATRFGAIALLGPKRLWSRAQGEELQFWDDILATGGGKWGDVYPMRYDPEWPLQDYLCSLVAAPPGATVRILDVGAGPLTIVGKKWPGREVQITAVDPNAEAYDRLLTKHGVRPPVRTRFGYAELLTTIVPHSSFDLVHSRNAVDHSRDAVLAIEQMITCAKPGGWVFLHHSICEGEKQRYTGPHQWNFYPRDGAFHVGRPGRLAVNVTRRLADRATVEVRPSHDSGWFVVVMKRHPAADEERCHC